MQIDKKDIEEVGEAVEALGVMMERELQKINLQLNQLIQSISEARSQEKNWEEEIPELRSQIQKTKELLEGFEVAFSRTESRISELQTVFQDEED
ncbi:MAG: hypothetical protein MUO91_09610, partial [candidate division Zixibacteria bacterium]|nr:hypothetical protein [candidate division Zixibacteria bacterium]